MFLKVLWFVLFVVAYGVWSFLSYKTLEKFKQDSRSQKWFWSNQVMLALPVFMFVLIYMLSGSFNLWLVLVFFGAAQFGLIVSAILWACMGTTAANWRQRWIWAVGECARKNLVLSAMIGLLTFLVSLAYPIVAGVLYFNHETHSPELSTLSFRWTLASIGLSGYPSALFFLIAGLGSENLDEETRARVFVTQLGSFFQLGLLLSLAFWAFGIGQSDASVRMRSGLMSISPSLAIVLVSYLVLAIILPYAAGSARAKKKRIRLLERRRRWIGSVYDLLDAPTASAYDTKLDRVMTDLRSEGSKILSEDAMVDAGAKIDRALPTDYLPAEVADAYKLTRDLDPRFTQLDWLEAFAEEITTIRDSLKQAGSNDDRVKLAQAWAENYESKKEELDEQIKDAKQERVSVWVAVGFILTPIVTGLLGKVAEAIWAGFSAPAGK